MQTFTDLVGTTVVPAHCFGTDELTDLTPDLDTVTASMLSVMAADAREAGQTIPTLQCGGCGGAVPDMATWASEANYTTGPSAVVRCACS